MLRRVPRGDRPARRAGEHDDRFGADGTNDAGKDLDLVVEPHRGRAVSIREPGARRVVANDGPVAREGRDEVAESPVAPIELEVAHPPPAHHHRRTFADSGPGDPAAVQLCESNQLLVARHGLSLSIGWPVPAIGSGRKRRSQARPIAMESGDATDEYRRRSAEHAQDDHSRRPGRAASGRRSSPRSMTRSSRWASVAGCASAAGASSEGRAGGCSRSEPGPASTWRTIPVRSTSSSSASRLPRWLAVSSRGSGGAVSAAGSCARVRRRFRWPPTPSTRSSRRWSSAPCPIPRPRSMRSGGCCVRTAGSCSASTCAPTPTAFRSGRSV